MNVRRGMIALAVALAVGGCSEGEKRAGSLPQITSTPTASPTPTPSVPPFPATQQGAAAFVQLWVATANAAGQTGEVARLRLLSANTCRSCTGLIAYFERSWAMGRLEGGSITLKNLVAADVDAVHANLTANFAYSAERRYDEAGQLVASRSATVEGQMIRLARVGDGWQLASLTDIQ